MTDAVPWLLSLPQCPLPRESSEALGDNVVEFGPDVGPPMRRQKSTVAYDTVTLTFGMSYSQTMIFRHDYRTRLGHGSVAFTLPRDPFTRNPAEYQFKSSPQFTRVSSNHYRVTFDALRSPDY